MITIAICAWVALTITSASTFVVLHRQTTRLQANQKELWQLSIQAGMERYRHAQTLHKQIDALAERCMEHGDSGQQIAEILRSATAIRPS